MKYRDPSTGQFRDLHFKVSDTLPIGFVGAYSGVTAPEGWLICDGAAVSRTAYSALFAAIGTTYGAGDGSTTFNLPDYRDRVPVGLDANDSDFNVLGKTLGSKSNTYDLTHKHTQGNTGAATGNTGSTTLTVNQIPSHTHGQYLNSEYGEKQPYALSGGGGSAMTGYYVNTSNVSKTTKDRQVTTGATGGGQGHTHSLNNHTHTNPATNNALGNTVISTIQQSIVTNYIIKAYQVVAAPGTVKNEYTESDKHVYSTNYVNDKLAGIIESGSNENGNWIKYVDGTMICYGLTTLTAITSRSAGGLSYYSAGTEITLPQTFIDTNYRFQSTIDMANMNYFAQSYLGAISSSTMQVSFVSTGQNETRNIHWQAIGRWK